MKRPPTMPASWWAILLRSCERTRDWADAGGYKREQRAAAALLRAVFKDDTGGG